MEKVKKVLKIIGIIILILAVLAVAGGLYFVKFNQDQIAILNEETEKISQIDLLEQDIDMEIKTKGKYAIVESTMKEYMNKVKTLCNNIITLCDESDIDEVLSSENIENDGPDFIQTKAEVANFKTEINDFLEQTKTLLNEENIKSEITGKDLPDEYQELYNKIMIDQDLANFSEVQLELQLTMEELDSTLDTIDEILDYLSENSSYWEVKDGKIQFRNVRKLTEYYQLLNKVSNDE